MGKRSTSGGRMTRRAFTTSVGAAAIGASMPAIGAALSAADKGKALDHVVVIMFENRSFDNVLGRLYHSSISFLR